MMRLLAKFAAATFGVTLTSIVLLMLFYERAQEQFIKPRVVKQMDDLATMLKERLSGLTPEDAQAELNRLADSSGFRGRIVNSDAAEDVEEHRVLLELEGQPWQIELTTNEMVLEHFSVLEGFALIAASAATIGLAMGSGLFLALPLVRKLRRQEETVSRIADGDLTARVPTGSRDAFGRLGERINAMAGRIQELLRSHHELIRTVSHEMRTPVSRLQFSLEMLDGSSEAERRERIASMQEDIQELDELLEELLMFQRLESKTHQLERENVDVHELLDRVVHRLSGNRSDVVIRLAGENGPPGVVGNERLLTRAIQNVVQNAVRFAESEVVVSCESERDAVAIHISDDGPGIPPEDCERIFEPFVALSDRDQAGTGLGLAIARHIVHDHDGTITVENRPPRGALFRIRIPCGLKQSETN